MVDQIQQPYRYPVVPNFRSWWFPQDVPPLWQTPATDGVLHRHEIWASQSECRLTEESLAIDQAHIIPQSEERWFMENTMIRKFKQLPDLRPGPVNLSPINRDNNLLALRTDIHRLWDQKQITFVPKRNQDAQNHLVVHCFKNDPELIQLYHNRLLADVHQPWEFFLARLAYTLLPSAIIDFLGQGEPRVLRMIMDDGKIVEREFSATDCDSLRCAPRPRSTSPKKRKAENDASSNQTALELESGNEITTSFAWNQCGVAYDDFDSGLGTPEDRNEHDYTHDYEMSVRGRKRLRV